jgi:superfamily II DNA or RNA helicase
MRSYSEFIESKRIVDAHTGLANVPELNPALFPFQRDIVNWALKRGRAAIFADCGMGKTPMQLEWAKHVPGEILILAPLAVSAQTVREGEKFGITCAYARNESQIKERITVTNYEMLEHFDPDRFNGVVLDESSILKAYNGKTRTQIIDGFAQTPFRLACTATPSPNDYMELGNHSQYLGVMSYTEMLSMFFVHDGGETQKWRLKGHAEADGDTLRQHGLAGARFALDQQRAGQGDRDVDRLHQLG